MDAARRQSYQLVKTMKNLFSRLTAVLFFLFCLAAPSPAAGQATESEQAGRKAVIVQDKFGGQIFGYDVDRNGSEGMLSEIVELSEW